MPEFIISADHPALPGHFPGQPIVPGVVIVDHVMALLAETHDLQASGIRKLKFLKPLLPGQPVSVTFAEPKNGRIRFRCESAGELLAEGNLQLSPPLS